MHSDFDPVFNFSFAKEHGLVLIESGEVARIGTIRDVAPTALIEVRRAAGSPIVFERISEPEFERRLSEVYSSEALNSADLADDINTGQDDLGSVLDEIPQTADLLDSDDDAPIIRLINGLIAEAVKSRASDIHIEPFETKLSVRLRVDGVLQEILVLVHKVAPLLISRIKVMARLDIAEKRVPQDGRMSLSIGGRSIDVRVSTLPSRHGERVVLRLLDKDQSKFNLSQLGMSAETKAGLKQALSQPNGIILVTGPTGSGKTTTLYAGLGELNDQTRNILTVEDPVEYALEGVGQTQVNPKVGMTFAAGLRAILRQDPDVVMVGEIRDVETAQIAVQASLTGHLVLSTVHTNDAVSAITRLRDMGIEPFLLASTIKGILAQRLVRRLCPACKTPVVMSESERVMRGLDSRHTMYQPNGCPECKNTGYQGRLGIYELVLIDEELRRMIHDDAREADMAAVAFRRSDTLAKAGARHVSAGETSIEEVMRVCRQDGEGDGGL